MSNIELLAPAGNFECLVAAVQSGADAVYLAGKSFGARSFADNFDKEELEKAVDYCHIRGVHIYITVNTLVADSEIEELGDYLRLLSEIGVDAIIVQDFGVAEIATQLVPELPIHASTQMTIHNSEGVKFVEKYGIKRVVLSRELSLREIKEISSKTDAELEVFGHGALCMCYSGQCLLSSIIGGRSGNRGKCAQPCRLQYSINNSTAKAYYMSLKDLSSLCHLKELENAGVSSLKIEGRMKGPAYVAAVVGIYRKYLDNPMPVSQKDMELLDTIFNRGGLTDGYLTGNCGRDMFALDKPDNPYRKGSSNLEKELLSVLNEENRKLKIDGEIVIRKDEYPIFKLRLGNVFCEYVHHKTTETAQKKALEKKTVIAQLVKTGATSFEFENISVELDDGLFLSAGELNSIRRNALEMLEETYLFSFKREVDNTFFETLRDSECEEYGFVCEITNESQLDEVCGFPFEKLYIPIEIIRRRKKICDSLKEKTVIVLPAILREEEFEKYTMNAKKLLDEGYHGVQVQNPSEISAFSKYKIYGGFRLNIFGSNALNFLKKNNVKTAELSPELTIWQLRDIKKTLPVQVMVYGRLPLMVTENCIIRNGNQCPCNGENYITDRMGMKFPVIKDGEICRSVVLNCKKTYMANDMEKLRNAGINYFRIYFSDESAEECRKVCEAFLSGGNYRPEDFTKGHFFKGVTKEKD